ncbi:hypothetical protein GJV85_07450 [Sulfurimonas aquatica]|uniref:Uncharacterized protein n=1 Tax=Sulfurimonas aquatica TaxID=2672570 RepID=A0A975GD38_9BACT|nr:hypothetical protein [Sulfurimonas aquatica]QSZ41948.1 hypothetical protein GJV85_07450 [Sulfurimonas aquatica]
MKNFLKRVKSTKGMSGVLIALLLVVVGVGLVAGVDTWMGTQKTAIEGAAKTKIDAAIAP